MAVLLRASVLSDDEKAVVSRLAAKIRKDKPGLDLLDKYFGAKQRLQHIGIAVPAELRIFETVVNIPHMAVMEPAQRQELRTFYRAGDSTVPDLALREAWEFNNLSSESSTLQVERGIFGCSYVTVGWNGDDPQHPLIRVEDPRSIGVDVDPLHRRMRAFMRIYRDDDAGVTRGTLLLPDETIHMVRGQRGWEVTDGDGYGRDRHGLGVVPAVMFLNRRRSASWTGRSEMTDVIGLTDGIARLVTNMQVGAESHALPSYILSGVASDAFKDRDGNILPVWEAYFTAIKAIASTDVEVHQISAGDLKNFTESVDSMMNWCAAVLGLPTRFMGRHTANPAAEGAIRADEFRLTKNAEWKNRFDGDSWSWTMALEERFRTGKWGPANSIRAIYHDPGTPTYGQRADAVTKLRAAGALSLRGVWEELGWDDARMDREEDRLAAEAADPTVMAALAEVTRARDVGAALPGPQADGGGGAAGRQSGVASFA